jgi:WD40 repeat protein
VADKRLINILSFLPNDHKHLQIASRVNRRLNGLAQSPMLWSNLIKRTPGPVLSSQLKNRDTTTTSPGTWDQDGVWIPTELHDKIHYPTLYRSRYLLNRVVRGDPLPMFASPHVDTLHFSGPIYCIHASGPWLILGGKDKAIEIWRTAMGNNVLVKKISDAHEGSVLALAVEANEEGAKVISGSSDGTAVVWDIKWRPMPEDSGGDEVDGEDSGPQWKVDAFRKETLRGHTAAVLDVALAKNYIITCSKDTTIRIYNRHDYSLCRAIVGLHSQPVNCLALHPDPNVPEFISASGDGYWVRGPIQEPTYYTRHGKQSSEEHGHALACVAWGGPFVVTGGKDAHVDVHDVKGETMAGHRLHKAPVRAVDLDVDESGVGTIVSASYDETVVLWDTKTYRKRYAFKPHASIILDVQLTNGRLITYVLIQLSFADMYRASHDQTVQIRTFGQDLPYRDLFV